MFSMTPERKRLLKYQILMFLITFFNESMLHATRSIWSAGTKDFQKLYGFSKTTIAAMNTTFLAFYGVGSFFSGHIADMYKKPKLIFCLYTSIAVIVFLVGSLRFVPKESQHNFLWAYFVLKVLNGAL